MNPINVKSFYTSKTFWSGIVSIITGIAMIAEQGQVSMAALSAILAGVGAIIGRVQATGPIGLSTYTTGNNNLKKINHPLILLAVSSLLFLLSLSNIFSSCFHYPITKPVIESTDNKMIKHHGIIKNKPQIKNPNQTLILLVGINLLTGCFSFAST